MKVNLAKSAGFCVGVKRAIRVALETARAGGAVHMLGDIVHNEDVVNRIRAAGITKRRRLTDGRGKTLLIRAHGASLRVVQRAERCGYRIVDATCPMVKDIHRIAGEMERRGYRIIVIGDPNHDEVQGIVGQLAGKALVVDRLDHVPRRALARVRRAAVVVQSTQNLEKVLEIVARLERLIRELKFFNTICRPTRRKQEEARRMPLANDAMVIIGSKTSANTRRLYEIARSLNRRTHWVQAARDLKPHWFTGARRVGVMAGASTPDETTRNVVARLRRIGPDR
ncbi:MAG: 4-hydroxy-3-methylbut-2-enyl diphosphate reductase [Kiritimatiellae bacterium]|nr:4-hydroxy-3-methylbut-2-enyl diphosphate reductase [Kiritimatiellia bacterium]